MTHADGLLLFAHGARDPRWALPFEDVAQRARAERPALPVVLAFLEFMAPDLLQAGADLVARGCTRVCVVPLFLGAGGHVRRDLPRLLETLGQAHPGVTWTLTQAIGERDDVIARMAASSLALLDASAAQVPVAPLPGP